MWGNSFSIRLRDVTFYQYQIMNTTTLQLQSLAKMKLIALALFFLTIVGSSLSAMNGRIAEDSLAPSLSVKTIPAISFEITSAFISTWKVVEAHTHTTLEVAKITDFKTAHEITEKLQKIIMEPILVHHGYENNTMIYTIVIGRFSNVDDAIEYHNSLR